MRLIPALLAAALVLTVLPARPTGAADAQLPQPPTVGVTAAEVSVDFVVRDKKGRLVSDLAPGDVEIYEDGVRQPLALFRLMRGTVAEAPAGAEPAAHGAPATPALAPAAQAAPNVEREAVVALVFDRLSPPARRNACDAALAWLKLPALADRRIGVFRIDQRLEAVQELTDDRGSLMDALGRVLEWAPTAYEGFGDRERLRGARAQLSAMEGRSSPLGLVGGLSADQEGGVVSAHDATRGQSSVEREVARLMLMSRVSMLEASAALERDQQGLATTNALLALVNGLKGLPGRKAVVFFSEGLALPDRVTETLRTVVSEANRGQVSFYAADAAGLRTTSGAEETRRELAGVVDERDAIGDDAERRGSMTSITRVMERNANALRLDPASGLGTLARDTGGFLVHDTNDVSGGLRRVEEDLGSYYLASYVPREDAWDGGFRRIELKLRRSGLSVQARRGYYAVRSSTPTPLLDYEAPALARFERTPGPGTIPIRARAVQFPAEDGQTLVALLAQVPGGAPSLVRDADAVFRQDFSVLALVRDPAGRIVHKSSGHYALAWPSSRVEDVRRGRVLFEREALLGPGRYTAELVVHDAQGGALGVERFPLDVPAAPAGSRLSQLVVVGHAEPRTTGDPGPLLYRGLQLYPTFGETVSLAAGKPLAFLFALRPAAGPLPAASVELSQGDAVARRADVALGSPDETGLVRVIGGLPLEGLAPGDYVLRLVLSDGRSLATRSADVTLAP